MRNIIAGTQDGGCFHSVSIGDASNSIEKSLFRQLSEFLAGTGPEAEEGSPGSAPSNHVVTAFNEGQMWIHWTNDPSNDEGLTDGLVSSTRIGDMVGTFGKGKETLGPLEGEPDRNAMPGICVIDFKDDALGYTSRDTGMVEFFLKGIPTIEMSRAVPYFNLNLVETDYPQTTKTNANKPGPGISMYKWMFGNTPIEPLPDAEIDKAHPYLGGLRVSDDTTSPGSSAGAGIAGMELFTMPQSLVNGNEPTYVSFVLQSCG